MDDWIEHVCTTLDIPRDALDVDAVLDLARDASHSVDRPAAPVTAYLLGYVAGRHAQQPGADPDEPARALERIAADARGWSSAEG